MTRRLAGGKRAVRSPRSFSAFGPEPSEGRPCAPNQFVRRHWHTTRLYRAPANVRSQRTNPSSLVHVLPTGLAHGFAWFCWCSFLPPPLGPPCPLSRPLPTSSCSSCSRRPDCPPHCFHSSAHPLSSCPLRYRGGLPLPVLSLFVNAKHRNGGARVHCGRDEEFGRRCEEGCARGGNRSARRAAAMHLSAYRGRAWDALPWGERPCHRELPRGAVARQVVSEGPNQFLREESMCYLGAYR